MLTALHRVTLAVVTLLIRNPRVFARWLWQRRLGSAAPALDADGALLDEAQWAESEGSPLHHDPRYW